MVVEGYAHPFISPASHFENIYQLPAAISQKIIEFCSRLALAVRQTYTGCEGVTILQNNEPASNQHAFHYHMHLFPRFLDHKFYRDEMMHNNKVLAVPAMYAIYAKKLRDYLKIIDL